MMTVSNPLCGWSVAQVGVACLIVEQYERVEGGAFRVTDQTPTPGASLERFWVKLFSYRHFS
jgi:hypothetical protein